MSLNFFIAGIILTTILAFGSFGLIVFLFSPENADAPLLALLFLSLFFSLAGFFSLLGLYFRRRKKKDKEDFGHIKISFRQGALLAFLIAGSLFLGKFLKAGRWPSYILLALVVLIEILCLRARE